MTFPLALLQASDNNMTLIMLAVVTLATLIALGKNFFVALIEIITAPQASLAHHGERNTFFFHLMVVFLGGLIGMLYLTYQQPQISSDLTSFAQDTGQAIAQGHSNGEYREIAGQWGAGKIDIAFQTYVVGNFIWFPILMIGGWIVVGMLFWACSKMFGAQASLSKFLGALSFSAFFAAIAKALALPFLVKSATASLFTQPPPQDMGVPLIIAGVLGLYALTLFCMGVVQGAEITAGQFIIALILLAIVLGGIGYYIQSQQLMPQAQAFAGQVTSLDPSQAGFTMPGAGGYTPPAASPDMSEAAPAPQSGLEGNDDNGGVAVAE